MIRTLENILGYRIVARDGEIGKVQDFFIDDSLWRLRYIVAETGSWMSRQRVLLSLAALGEIRSERRAFHVNLSREQVSGAPGIDTDKPVSRQQELMMNNHYGWPAYWSPDGFTISESMPAAMNRTKKIDGDHHLRSFREISSYAIKCGEVRLGKVEDFVFDDADWSLRSLVMRRDSWLESRRIALPAGTITELSWSDRTLGVDVVDSDLPNNEPFNYNEPVNREECVMYFDYYGRPAEPPLAHEHNPA